MMKVSEIEEGKKACVLFDCGTARVYYPKPGNEDKPDATCNYTVLEFEEDGCEESAMLEAAVLLDIPEDQIERAYG